MASEDVVTEQGEFCRRLRQQSGRRVADVRPRGTADLSQSVSAAMR
jgi:hypothetical protein